MNFPKRFTQGQGFSWGQVIGYGLKLLLAAIGGGSTHDGIDKMDTGASPVQVWGLNQILCRSWIYIQKWLNYKKYFSIIKKQGIVKTLIGTLVGGEDGEKADNMAKQTGEVIIIKFALFLAASLLFVNIDIFYP